MTRDTEDEDAAAVERDARPPLGLAAESTLP